MTQDNAPSRADLAERYFREGYNCAQAVTLAFSDLIGLPPEKAASLSSSFGGGFGRNREICGAVSGGCIVIGALMGTYPPDDRAAKAAHYETVRGFMRDFAETNGSYVCRDLLSRPEKGGEPSGRDDAFYHKRPCVELVRSAAGLLEKTLLSASR